MSEPLIQIRGLHKSYWLNDKRIDVLRGVDLDIGAGEMVSLIGASGVGKSTFLHVLGTLDVPTSGEVRIGGENVFARNEASLADFRNRTIGFVFQSHYLLPEFTALQNAAMPALIQRLPRADAEARAKEMLAAVGLGERMDHKPGELSGGEQQRVALARALVLKPQLLLADEPTGNLDPATGEGIHQLLFEMNRKLGITAVVVTHNDALAQRMPRALRLVDGKLAQRGAAPAA
jgi:lipoprotein-releasing system ATP-binding protein